MTPADAVRIIEYKTSDGMPVENGHTLTVHYVAALTLGALDKGPVLERSYDQEAIRFVLGAGRVLHGIDLGLVGMRVGSTRRIVLPPALAFGSKGIPGKVPPDSSIAFEVYLIQAE